MKKEKLKKPVIVLTPDFYPKTILHLKQYPNKRNIYVSGDGEIVNLTKNADLIYLKRYSINSIPHVYLQRNNLSKTEQKKQLATPINILVATTHLKYIPSVLTKIKHIDNDPNNCYKENLEIVPIYEPINTAQNELINITQKRTSIVLNSIHQNHINDYNKRYPFDKENNPFLKCG